MNVEDLKDITESAKGRVFLSDEMYKHETLRVLLEIRNQLKNISGHVYELNDSIDYLSSKFKRINDSDPFEGAI